MHAKCAIETGSCRSVSAAESAKTSLSPYSVARRHAGLVSLSELVPLSSEIDLSAQEIVQALGLAPSVVVGQYNALAMAGNQSLGAAAAAAMSVYDAEIAVLNLVNAGATLLSADDARYQDVGMSVYLVRLSCPPA